MQIITPLDIEEVLRLDLTSLYTAAGITGISFSAPPVPPTLGELPSSETLVCLKRVGGSRSELVVDTYPVSIDVYGATWEDSIAEANRLAGVIAALTYQTGTQIQYHRASIETMPYPLPDTSNPVFPRVRMLVTIIAKGAIAQMA